MSQEEQSAALGAQRLKRLGLVALVLIAAWSTLAIHAVHAVLPNNPIKLPLAEVFDIRLILPEGWAFFTRDPRDPEAVVYLRGEDGQWRISPDVPRFHLSNAFGLDRYIRAHGVEMGLVMEEAQKAVRSDCEKEPQECLEKATAALTVNNPSPRPQLCGQVGIVLRKPVPWAWSRSHQQKPISMPSKVLRLEVQC